MATASYRKKPNWTWNSDLSAAKQPSKTFGCKNKEAGFISDLVLQRSLWFYLVLQNSALKARQVKA